MGPQGGGQQGRRRGGGRGGGNQTPSISVFVTGTRSECVVKVIMRQGNQLLPNRPIHFRLGNEGDFQGPWIMDPANPAQRFQAVTDQYGEWQLPAPYFDFSFAEAMKYSHITAFYAVDFNGQIRVVEQSAALPASVSAGTALKSPKLKRMKALPEDSELSSRNNIFSLEIATTTATGTAEAVDLEFDSDEPVRLVNKSTGVVLGEAVTATALTVPASGKLKLEIRFEGFERKVTFTHPSGEKIAKTLKFAY